MSDVMRSQEKFVDGNGSPTDGEDRQWSTVLGSEAVAAALGRLRDAYRVQEGFVAPTENPGAPGQPAREPYFGEYWDMRGGV